MVTWDSYWGWQTQQEEVDNINRIRKMNGKEPLPGGTPTQKAPMTLDEAIKHCEEKANEYGCCDDCRMEHKQLADWFKELKSLKEKYNV